MGQRCKISEPHAAFSKHLLGSSSLSTKIAFSFKEKIYDSTEICGVLCSPTLNQWPGRTKRTERSRRRPSNVSTTRITIIYEHTSLTPLLSAASHACSGLKAALHPTNTSTNSGLQSQIVSSTIRPTKCQCCTHRRDSQVNDVNQLVTSRKLT